MTTVSDGVAALREFLYTTTPIFLENGLADKVLTGGLGTAIGNPLNSLLSGAGVIGAKQLLPIIAITEPLNAVINLFTSLTQRQGANMLASYNFRFAFSIDKGAVIFNATPATYPMKNMTIAVNTMIETPNSLTVTMRHRIREHSLLTKPVLDMQLKQYFLQHMVLGGAYTVVTPSVIFSNCMLTNVVDNSPDDLKQPFSCWRLSFVQPVVTEAAGVSSLNKVATKVENGVYQ